VRDGIRERQWESTDGRSKIAQIDLCWSRVKDVLTELHRGLSGGHLGVNKALNKFWQRYYWLQKRSDVGKWCRQCDTCAVSRGPRTRIRSQMHPYKFGAPFERIAIDVAWPFPQSDQGLQYPLIAVDYLPSGRKPTPVVTILSVTIDRVLIGDWI
jgi:hypothetical protein